MENADVEEAQKLKRKDDINHNQNQQNGPEVTKLASFANEAAPENSSMGMGVDASEATKASNALTTQN